MQALSLALSATIAGTLGMGLMTALVLLSLKALGKYRATKRNLKKIDNVKRQDRINAIIEVVALDYRQAIREAAKVMAVTKKMCCNFTRRKYFLALFCFFIRCAGSKVLDLYNIFLVGVYENSPDVFLCGKMN